MTFVPAENYTGTVTISYTARDSGNGVYNGKVTITVAGGGGGDISYQVSSGDYVTFNRGDFNDLCRDATGRTLDYIRFTSLPSSSEGTLYYRYRSSGSYDSQVTEGRSYYRSSSPYLRRVTFVAGKDYSGTVHIPFTGWDTKGNRFSGTVAVEVGRTGDGDVRYSTYRNGRITFDDGDFNTLCRELTKLHEEITKTTIGEAVRYYEQNDPRGEYVLVMAGTPAAQAAAEEVTLPDAVATARLLMAQGTPPAAAAKQAAKGTPFSKGDIYKELIAAKDEDDREEESE